MKRMDNVIDRIFYLLLWFVVVVGAPLTGWAGYGVWRLASHGFIIGALLFGALAVGTLGGVCLAAAILLGGREDKREAWSPLLDAEEVTKRLFAKLTLSGRTKKSIFRRKQ